MDEKQAMALLEALKPIAGLLGKESEYRRFSEYITWSEKAVPHPSVEQIAANTSSWIKILSPPLKKLYASGYDNGQKDASEK